MLFDSHTHVNFENFDDDRDTVIARCLADGVWMVNVGSDVSYSQKAVTIAERYEQGVYASAGIHPDDAVRTTDEDFLIIEQLAKNPKVVGIGETGLDYYGIRNQESGIRKKQQELFIKHIELAKNLNKPLIIHCRDAHKDLLSILNSLFVIHDSSPKGVMHFFCGTAEEALAYCGLGFYISFSGVITFARDYDETVRAVPLERILVETDAPFVAPVPHRGKRNEPHFVEYAARKIAELKGISFEEVAEQTTKNTKELFKI